MAKKGEETHEEESVEDEGGVRIYELGFHLNPELPIEEVKKAYQAVRSVIAERGTVIAEGEPLPIQLAYTISLQETAGRRDFSSAYFCWIAYAMTAALHAEVLAAVSAEKRVLRHIDLLTTKEAALHAAELREIIAKTPGRADDAEMPADAELDAALETAAL